MPASTTSIHETELMNYIQNGATRLTPRQARQLVTNEFAEVTQFHRAEFNVMPDVA